VTKSAVDLVSVLRTARIVDLSHTFFPGQPHHPALPDQEVIAVIDFDSDFSSLVQQYRFVGQWGTHIDAPLHFHRSAASLDQLPVEQSILPLVVLDIHERVSIDPDTVASLDDVHLWEAAHGRIPLGAFVALRTDWSLRWPNNDQLDNIGADGFSHRPGWSRAVLEFLVDERSVTAIGHETADTDSGYSVSAKHDYSLERYFLGTGRWQIELLNNLRIVPPSGAVIFVGWPKPKGGSGFPVRAIAIFDDSSGR
jgi:kynurenine formamidase